MKRTLFLMLIGVLLAGTVFIACSKKAPAASTPAQEMIIANHAEPQSLDPSQITGVPEHRIYKALFEGINSLNHFPERGGYVPELLKHNIKDYRQLIESPWRIIYKIDKNIVSVLLLIDSRRNTQDILVERLLNK